MARERFYFYEKWWRVLQELPEQSALAVYKAACTLVFDDKDISGELDTEARVAFMFIRQEIERDQEAYNSVVERNRANGQNGGRPRRSETQENPKNPVGYKETQENPKNPSKPDKNREEEIGVDKKGIDNTDNSLSLEEQRQREIFQISLLFLRKGVKLPSSEAEDYYNYYQASGWRKSNEHQTPIVDKVAYALTWKTKRETIISEEEGEVWAKIIERIGFTNMRLAAEFINNYRGYLVFEQTEVRFYFSTRSTKGTFDKLFATNQQFKDRMQNHLEKFGIKTISCDIAANDPRR